MEIRRIDTCIATYDKQFIGDVNIIKPDEAVADGGEGWLMIDDLVDTGTTMKTARDLPKCYVATVMPNQRVFRMLIHLSMKSLKTIGYFFPGIQNRICRAARRVAKRRCLVFKKMT